MAQVSGELTQGPKMTSIFKPYANVVPSAPIDMTTFYIKNSFAMAERQSIVFEGEIIKGTVSIGQKIKMGQTDRHPAIELEISGVEFIDHRADKTAYVGLIVKFDSGSDLSDILDYEVCNETCEVV